MTDIFKKKIIYFFIGFSILLMVTNVIIDFVNTVEEEEKKYEISIDKIDEQFSETLSDFGIANDWISVKKINNKSYDSLKKVFYLKIPTDLSIPIFLKELESKFIGQPVSIISEERKDNGNSTIRISSNDHLKFQAFLNYDNSITRENFKFAFLVDDFQDLSSTKMDQLFQNQFNFGVGLIPSNVSIELIKKISQFKKENYFIINDEVSDSKYELDPSLSKTRLKSSIISIVSDYSSSIFCMIDKSSELYSSTSYNFIRDELLKRKIRLHSYENFIDLRSKEGNDLKSLFKFYCEDKETKTKIFLVNFNGLNELHSLIKQFQKKGNKLINPSELIFSE